MFRQSRSLLCSVLLVYGEPREVHVVLHQLPKVDSKPRRYTFTSTPPTRQSFTLVPTPELKDSRVSKSCSLSLPIRTRRLVKTPAKIQALCILIRRLTPYASPLPRVDAWIGSPWCSPRGCRSFDRLANDIPLDFPAFVFHSIFFKQDDVQLWILVMSPSQPQPEIGHSEIMAPGEISSIFWRLDSYIVIIMDRQKPGIAGAPRGDQMQISCEMGRHA